MIFRLEQNDFPICFKRKTTNLEKEGKTPSKRPQNTAFYSLFPGIGHTDGSCFADFQPIETQKKRTNARFFQLVSYLIHPSEFHTIENQIRRSGVPLDILSGNSSPLRQKLPVGKQAVHRPPKVSASVTSIQPPSRNKSCASRNLRLFGPISTGTPYTAASGTLWMPTPKPPPT